MPDRNEIDVLIDSALTTYAEPRPGLEQRMLARISDQRAQSLRRRRFLLGIIAPVMTSLLLFTYLLLKTPHSQRSQLAYTPTEPSTSAVARPAEPHSISRPLRGARVSHKGAIRVETGSNAHQRPKLEIFPTPQPLDAGEQALSRFAAQAPEADRKAFLEARQNADEPLKITAISIPPLKTFEENQN